jgi:hypothetical protein
MARENVCMSKREQTRIILSKAIPFPYVIDLEDAIFACFEFDKAKYIEKARAIRQNINLQRNPFLYNALITRQMSGASIVNLNTTNMANRDKQHARTVAQEHSFFESMMTEQVRHIQRSSILFEDSTKKAKLWGNDEKVGNF